jgi:hypothetical protein
MKGDSSIKVTALPDLYLLRLSSHQSIKAALLKAANQISLARLATFLLLLFFVYLSFKLKSNALLILPILLISIFLSLVKKATTIRRKINFHQTLISINQNEINALNGDLSAFDPGANFIDYHHEYSYDLDIFGEHSIYRLVNRTATPLGKEKLASRLLFPGTNAAEIRARQESIKELVGKLPWRQDFLATALESDWEKTPDHQVRAWLDAPDVFTKTQFFKWAIWLNSIISVSLIILYVLSAFNLNIFAPNPFPSALLLYFIVPISLIVSQTRLINREQQRLERLLDLFRKYAGLLTLIENEPFESSRLINLKKSLMHGDVLSSQIMNKLTGILWGLEVRGNLIVSFFLNAFFLWDIILMTRLEKWRRNYRDSFGKWIETIAEFETLNSLANLAFNRPDLSWPEILDGDFTMEIIEGGHPLIDPRKRVDNSLSFHRDGRIYLVTGANMAGKSTLLRMVGVNMVLAMSGGPVCAKHFSMAPVSIHTSVRTNDSLGDDESYFYAELKKLSLIINRFEKGEKLFVVVDEMLKGTNSRDKHTGSAALIHRLINLGASGLVATHDVELGELEKEYPGKLVNTCFEVITDGDLLKFDYLLHKGVSKNLNATFLMKKMGIIKGN